MCLMPVNIAFDPEEKDPARNKQNNLLVKLLRGVVKATREKRESVEI